MITVTVLPFNIVACTGVSCWLPLDAGVEHATVQQISMLEPAVFPARRSAVQPLSLAFALQHEHTAFSRGIQQPGHAATVACACCEPQRRCGQRLNRPAQAADGICEALARS